MRPAIVEVVQELAPPGGIQVMVLELRRRLEPILDVHVVSLEGSVERLCATWPKVAQLGSRLHSLDKPPSVDISTVRRLTRLLREISPIAVHTHHIGPLLYGGLAARLARTPRLVHTEHDAWHLADPRRRRLQRAALAMLRPCLVADCRMVGEALERDLHARQPCIIPNGIDTARFLPGDRLAARQALGLPATDLLVGTAGRLEHVKGQDLLIEALAALPPGVTLAVAGNGSRRAALELQADRLGVHERVRFLGHVDDIVTFYQALDVFCLPSRAEGLPLSLLEAQACSIPILATDVGAASEVLVPGASGLVPPENSGELARGIAALLGRAPLTDPRSFVVEHYDLQGMAKAYLALLTN